MIRWNIQTVIQGETYWGTLIPNGASPARSHETFMHVHTFTAHKCAAVHALMHYCPSHFERCWFLAPGVYTAKWTGEKQMAHSDKQSGYWLCAGKWRKKLAAWEIYNLPWWADCKQHYTLHDASCDPGFPASYFCSEALIESKGQLNIFLKILFLMKFCFCALVALYQPVVSCACQQWVWVIVCELEY